MGIAASSGDAIAVTIDKDLKGVPGWHYNPDKDECPNYVDDAEADKFLAFQLIKGDSTDGIPGLPGKGKGSLNLRSLSLIKKTGSRNLLGVSRRWVR